MKQLLYIFQPVIGSGNERIRQHQCHRKNREGGCKGVNKPLPHEKCNILNRNAKFTPVFLGASLAFFSIPISPLPVGA